jgi:hypothetical protein
MSALAQAIDDLFADPTVGYPRGHSVGAISVLSP